MQLNRISDKSTQLKWANVFWYYLSKKLVVLNFMCDKIFS